MHKIQFHTERIIFFLFILLVFSSCSKKDDLSNLEDTIMVRHKDADMPAYIYGNGSEKVFLITLHGGPGGLGLGFRGTSFDLIEENCAVVYFDQRGSGMAQGSYSDEGITIDIMAEDVLALVKVIQQKYGNDSRFFLLGHSWGVTLGTATLLTDQNPFLGWICVDGTHNSRDLYLEYIANFERVAAEQIELGNSVPFWESVNELILEVEPVFNANDISRLNGMAFNAEQKLISDGFIIRPEGSSADILFSYNPMTFFWNILNTQSLLDPGIQGILSYTDRLNEIKIPSLLLWGEHDMVIPPIVAEEALENLGSDSKQIILFENSGHSPMHSESESFAAEVKAFIEMNN